MSLIGRWERFCNWLEAKPWRWRYDRIWRGIQGDPPFLRRLWWTVTFPHVHHDDEGAVDALDLAVGTLKRVAEGCEGPAFGAAMCLKAIEHLHPAAGGSSR